MTQWKNRTTAWHHHTVETERGGCEGPAMGALLLVIALLVAVLR